jgi:predicted RNase H-like nuclease (RuvC/YqgF family)
MQKSQRIHRPRRARGAREKPAERAVRAERELDAFKYRQHNEIYHRDSIIENLKRRNADLESELEAAHERIAELEGIVNEK